MWQPRVVGGVVLIGLITQWWPLFLALSVILWWNAALPRWNLFDVLYNRLIASRTDLPPLTPAPRPRRFAQGMAASFCLAIAVSLFFAWFVAAYVLEAFLVVALAALIFGRFCLGSYVYHLVTRERQFADRTLPWSRSE
jgi:uncharacterized protein DUF4395